MEDFLNNYYFPIAFILFWIFGAFYIQYSIRMEKGKIWYIVDDTTDLCIMHFFAFILALIAPIAWPFVLVGYCIWYVIDKIALIAVMHSNKEK